MQEARSRRYLNDTGQSDEMLPPAGYTFKQACIDEFGAFLDALDSQGEWYHPLRDGVQILRCLDAVKRRSASGKLIEICD